jgi:fructose-1,6-bisphosphatase/inositol monophosphatase family enzyme
VAALYSEFPCTRFLLRSYSLIRCDESQELFSAARLSRCVVSSQSGISPDGISISPMEDSQKLEALLSSIREAGDLLVSMWPGDLQKRGTLQVEEKADGTLVSQADMASNQMLIEAIERLFPDDAIVSEEIPVDSAKLIESDRTWIIDPLDGTSSFVHGRDDFSILVALAERGTPTLGVMLFPALAKLVVAGPGRQAAVDGMPLHVSTHRELQAGRVYIRNFVCARPELACPMMDSGLALLKVASGELDGAIIRMTTHREWDLAAPAAVLFSAGGCLSDETGAPIRFGTGSINFQYAIASNGLIHEQLQEVVGDSRTP